MSGYLLDSHLVIWSAGILERLTEQVRGVLQDTASELFVSSVTIAELNIKISLGKLTLPSTPVELARELGARPLALTWEHARQLSLLLTLHRDPFDRLLIAQAMVEKLTLITADSRILQYPDVELLAN